MEGLTPGGYRYRTRSRTGSLGCGKLMPPSSESKRGNNGVISETEAGDVDGTVKKATPLGIGHVIRMPSNRLPRRVLYGELVMVSGCLAALSCGTWTTSVVS